MICAACGHENPVDTRFCTECGSPIAETCPSCHVAAEPEQNFCGTCGTDLRAARIHESGANSPATRTPPHLARRILADRQAIVGERKRVTVMFADLVDSTAATESSDPEDAAAYLNTAIGAVMDVVHRYEGTVNELLGDGLVALFGAPIAHEDHAVRACLAGLEVQSAVAAATDEVARTRVGLHSGEVFVQAIGTDLSLEYQAIGPTVHLAARMEQAAEPGSVYVTATTRQLAAGFVDSRSVGPTEVKGVSEPVEVFELVRARSTTAWDARAARGLTRFVARDREVAVVNEALERSHEGDGQMVAIVGEPGIGKSRILHEFLAESTADLRVVRGHASPYDEDTTYFAVKSIVRSALDDPTDTGSVGAIAAALREVDDDLDGQAAGIAAVLDVEVEDRAWIELSPEARRRRVVEAVRRLVLARASGGPLVIAIEDLHWVDRGSQVVIDDLVEIVGGSPILLLVTHRTEYTHGWDTKSNFTRLRLGSLVGSQAEAMLDALIGADPSLDEIRPRLLDRSEGTPLFLEECVRSLVDAGRLEGEPGRYRASGQVSEVDIPDSVQAVLAARIDRLDPDAKFVVQAASVIGESVPGRLLDGLVGDTDLDTVTTELQNREFLYLHRAGSIPVYRFKHALTRDVAYESLPHAHRQDLHAELVRLMSSDRAMASDQVERLAHHAVRGGLWNEAVDHALAAGEKSIDRSAYAEASRFFRMATDALTQLPDSVESTQRAIDIRMRQRVAHTGAEGGLARLFGVLHDARDLAASIDDKRRLANVEIHIGYAANMQGEAVVAETASRRALELAEQLGDHYLAVESRLALGQTYDYAGRPRDVIETVPRDLEFLGTEMRHQRMGQTMIRSVVAHAHVAMASAFMGDHARADIHAREALTIADEAERPFDQLYAHFAMGLCLDQAGRTEEAVGSHQTSADIGEINDLWFIRTFAQPWRGQALLSADRPEEAATLLDEIGAAAGRVGLQLVENLAGVFGAEAHRRLGDGSRARRQAEASLRFAEAKRLPVVEIPALRTLAAVEPDPQAASELLGRAEAVAASLGYGPWLDQIRAQPAR